MEQIRHAIERSKESTVVPVRTGAGSGRQPFGEELDGQIRQVYLNRAHLESMRIVSHDGSDPHAGSFDMLRTQVLQAMDRSNWQFLAVAVFVVSPSGLFPRRHRAGSARSGRGHRGRWRDRRGCRHGPDDQVAPRVTTRRASRGGKASQSRRD